MRRYIDVIIPNDNNYQTNYALKDILSFVGERVKDSYSKWRVIKFNSDYEIGLDYLNRVCNKRCKRSIRKLINCHARKVVSGAPVQIWKVHKTKSERFLRRLHQVLKALKSPAEIWYLFDVLYKALSDDFPINKCGEDIISCPYKTELIQIKDGSYGYSEEERKVIKRVLDAFVSYDYFYNE